MAEIDLSRFSVTANSYKRLDYHDLQNGKELAAALTDTALVIPAGGPRQAWSFSRFGAGKMSGETWRDARGIILEYLWTGDTAEDRLARLEEIRSGAERSNVAYYILNTQTRQGEPTITVVFPLAQPVDVNRYVRIASVLANRIGAHDAASGIKSHTHLVHVDHDTVVEYRDGLLIDPEAFIRLTKHEAQNLDPAQFERSRPVARAAAAQLAKPEWTCADDDLFVWG